MKLKNVKQLAQYWANRTREATAAFKLPSGEVTYVLAGWPVEGKLLHTADPVPLSDPTEVAA